jgi:hypothetical protein
MIYKIKIMLYLLKLIQNLLIILLLIQKFNIVLISLKIILDFIVKIFKERFFNVYGLITILKNFLCKFDTYYHTIIFIKLTMIPNIL